MNADAILGKIKQWDINATLAKVQGESPDKWFCSMLEQAMNFLRTTKIFPDLRSAADGKFVLHGDRFVATSYEKETQQWNANASFCLPDNYHLHKINICTYADEASLTSREDPGFVAYEAYDKKKIPNHRQRPDAFALMRFKTEADDDRIMTVVYEGENHDKNQKNEGVGGWLWSKMFQAMGRCHDTDNNVSGVMISAVMHKHDPRNFTQDAKSQHFANVAREYLKAHVLLIARLVEYNTKNTKAESWIGKKLQSMRAPMHSDDYYDFVCTINAEFTDRLTGRMPTSTGAELKMSAILSPGQEFARYMDAARALYPQVTGHDVELGHRLLKWQTPVFRMQFRTGGAGDTADDSRRGMNVVIHAVLRAPVDALVDRRDIRGVLYPKHIESLCANLKRGREQKLSHIKRRPEQKIFEIPAKDLDTFLTWKTPEEIAAAAAAADAAVDDEDSDGDSDDSDSDEGPRAVRGSAPVPPPPEVNWMFGLELRSVHSIWNLWDLDYYEIKDNVDAVREHNDEDPPPVNRERSFLQKLKDKTSLKKGRALSCEMTGYFMFILPLMYMSMSVFRQVTDDLDYSTGTCFTGKQWTRFVDSFIEEIISRDKQANTVSSTQGLLFTKKSNSLFKTILNATHEEFADLPFDITLQNFLEKECGWRDIDEPASPAILFKILRATHVLSAQTLAKQVLSSPPLRYTQILETFPLGLQTEIQYVMGHLASFFFFKTKDWNATEIALEDEDEDGDEEEDEGGEDGEDGEDDEGGDAKPKKTKKKPKTPPKKKPSIKKKK